MAAIRSVSFGVLSASDVRSKSCCQVVSHETTVRDGGLSDPRMGSVERGVDCKTCGASFLNCPGHFGHIEFGTPLYSYAFVARVVTLLRALCHNCAKLLFIAEDTTLHRVQDPERRSKACVAQSLPQCPHCGTASRKVSYERRGEDGGINIDGTPLQAATAHALFCRVSDADASLLGCGGRPEDLIPVNMLVLPPCARPSVTAENLARSEDPLTHRLSDIMRALNDVDRATGPAHVREDALQRLQATFYAYIDAETSNSSSVRSEASVKQRLKGKSGRVRYNLMGKRVNNSARSVVSPDPNLHPKQVGVPRHIANTMSYPETVNIHNIQRLRRHVTANAPFIVPSGDSGMRIDLRFASRVDAAAALKYGDVVVRHVEDGDVLMLNRQPSLHKMSTMGHIVKIMDGNTIRFNPCVCTPYNADFDGDEMNLHLPQTESALAELRSCMSVTINSMDPKGNRSIIGLIQDTILAASMFTRPSTLFCRKDATFLASVHDSLHPLPRPAIVKPIPMWSGAQLFQMTLPRGIEYDNAGVRIRGGRYLYGQLSKRTLGNSSGSLGQIIANDYSRDAHLDFLYVTQLLVLRYMTHFRGFSIGVRDCLVTPATQRSVHAIIEDNSKEVQRIVRTGGRADIVESGVRDALNRATDSAGRKVREAMDSDNAFAAMVGCGSRGSVVHISQILGCVGQQNVKGARMACNLNGRSLPYFAAGDNGDTARGFVRASYREGLNIKEFVFHAQGGREGLIDTAVKTSDTGYIQRRLMKALEDLRVCFDGTVRSSNNEVVALSYGGDSMDGSYCELHPFSGGDTVVLPVHVRRLIKSATAAHPATAAAPRIDTHAHVEALIRSIASMMPGIETPHLLLYDVLRAEFDAACLCAAAADAAAQSIERRVTKALVSPGTCVGAVAAQSIGEPATQMCLNTFHSSGQDHRGLTMGVPRLRELVNVSKKIRKPQMLLEPKPGVSEQQVRRALELVEVHMLTASVCVRHEPVNALDRWDDALLLEWQSMLMPLDNASDYVMRLTLSHAAMAKKLCSMLEVIIAVKTALPDVTVEASDDNDDELVLRVRGAHGSDPDALQKAVAAVHIRGVPHVTLVARCDDTSMKMFTEGVNLRAALGCPLIARASSNDLLHTYEVLGIEAARETLLHELTTVIRFDGSYVDRRHISLLVDTMARNGFLMSATRQGFQKSGCGVLCRASFEQTFDCFTSAALNSSTDSVRGGTESVLLGQSSSLGTRMSPAYFDTEVVERSATEWTGGGWRDIFKANIDFDALFQSENALEAASVVRYDAIMSDATSYGSHYDSLLYGRGAASM